MSAASSIDKAKEGPDPRTESDVLAWTDKAAARFVGTAYGLVHDSRPRINRNPKLRNPS